ncbi:hypothetical protein SUGI_0663900 [Cryptomeria japonica]|uniref:protein RALF-like 34 n=1 Tax=Cryptomeria japonica TaxID=3369 RepID=UPI0024148EB2|nr:protein RALF-like 34 [Cryptomeria japonica]GLJ32969.1 hypothetical protein SUGI_0663900 [Cryptomeria japonica]
MAAAITQIAAVLVTVCIVVAADAQLASDWMSNVASYGNVGSSDSFDLAIESEGVQSCDGSLGDCGVFDEERSGHGRILRPVHYYISYGALAANRVPCPPRSGRSYYTPNCYKASGPVRPYHRGCSAVTRCYRDTS